MMINVWLFVAISCLIGPILSETISFEEAEKSPNCVCDGNYCRCVRYRKKYGNETEGGNANGQQNVRRTSTSRKYQTKNKERNNKSKEDVQDLNSIDSSNPAPASPPPPPLPFSPLKFVQNSINNRNSPPSIGSKQNGGVQRQQQKFPIFPPPPNLGQKNVGGPAPNVNVAGANAVGGGGNAIAGATAGGGGNAVVKANAGGNANAGAFASAGAKPLGNPFPAKNKIFPFGKKR